MHTLVLEYDPDKVNERALEIVVDRLVEVRAQSARVYQTEVVSSGNNSRRFCFITVSKDIHLMLGVLGGTARYNLALLLEREFKTGKCREVMIFHQEDRKRGMLATLVLSSVDEVRINLAIAN